MCAIVAEYTVYCSKILPQCQFSIHEHQRFFFNTYLYICDDVTTLFEFFMLKKSYRTTDFLLQLKKPYMLFGQWRSGNTTQHLSIHSA